jgi:hypothetical protein
MICARWLSRYGSLATKRATTPCWTSVSNAVSISASVLANARACRTKARVVGHDQQDRRRLTRLATNDATECGCGIGRTAALRNKRGCFASEDPLDVMVTKGERMGMTTSLADTFPPVRSPGVSVWPLRPVRKNSDGIMGCSAESARLEGDWPQTTDVTMKKQTRIFPLGHSYSPQPFAVSPTPPRNVAETVFRRCRSGLHSRLRDASRAWQSAASEWPV